jgi:hypothetical protein
MAPLSGTITLINTKQYPFNNSAQNVALSTPKDDQDYVIYTEVLSSTGEAGDIIITGKALNGFKIAFTGSAASAVIKYYISGKQA